MIKERVNKTIFIFLITMFTCTIAQEEFPPANLQTKIQNINNLRMKVTNYCVSSSELIDGAPAAITINFPAGSKIELGEHFGFWLGAKVDGVPLVTTGAAYEASAAGSRGARFEVYPRFNPNDTIYVKSLFGIVPDNAQKGLFFNEDGTLDENYLPKSESDLICQYWDNKILLGNTLEAPANLDTHVPLDANIIQRVYGWTFSNYQDIVFYDYFIINEGNKTWNDIYFAVYSDPQMGREEGQYVDFSDDYTFFVNGQKTMFNADAPGGNDGTIENEAMVGYRLIDAPVDINSSSVKYSFDYWVHNEDAVDDKEAYERMSSGRLKPDMDPQLPIGNIRSLMGAGPFGSLAPGDTMMFTVAVCGGLGKDDVLKSADAALALRKNGYNVPMSPPPPRFTAIGVKSKVTLDWKWRDEYEGINPEEFEDKSRSDDPYDFDGYRIYRSTQGPDGPWNLIAEFDLENGYAYDTGLQYEFTDNGLINGIRYWYAMTSFDIPEINDQINIPSMESPKILSIAEVIPSISREDTESDKVFVVPNPYRTDVDYTSSPSWEYPTQNRDQWYEVDRRLAFMNLPEECMITIYSINGMKIKEIEHTSGSIEYWNLLNMNDHAVATGLYYFHVKEGNGREQIGKFVIVK